MEWYNLITESLVELGSLVRQPPPFSLYKQQCSEIIRQFSTKLAKFWIIKTGTEGIQIECPDFEYMQRCPQALKEVYRVLKQALSFVHACSGEIWLTTALYKADTNEALLVHIHDLLWCVVGLDVCLHRAKGNSLESCSELLARRVRDCRRELESLDHRGDLLQQDVKQLLADLESFVGEDKFSRCRCWCLPSVKTKRNSRQIALHTVGTLVNQSVAMRCFGVEMMDNLGGGGFGETFRATWLGLWVAIKRSDPCSKRFSITKQCHFRHPFVVRTFGMIADARAYRVVPVMELISWDLGEEIRRRREETGMETKGPFPLAVAVDIMLQISRGVEYLHEVGVVHRDIKPGNLLVEPSEAQELYRGEGFVRIRICDFDLSVSTAPQTVQTDPELILDDIVITGTLRYVSPEYFTSPRVVLWKTDVYSFAITCSVILTGLSPWEGVQLNSAKMEQFIMQGHERPALLPSNCPPTLIAFISRCWDEDPAKRPHFREISIFLRHLKLVLMRVDDPKDFMSALTEFDCEEFEQHLKPSPLEPSEAEGSFQEPPLVSDLEGSVDEEEKEDDEIYEFLSSLRNYEGKEDELSNMPNFIWRMSLKDLSQATNNFSPKNRLGKGSSAAVYKGVLPNTMEVAVKRLNAGTAVFGTEARASSKVTHRNVIRLLGLCDEDGIKLLVYEFVIRGSLDNFLFGATAQSALNWRRRCKIALGIAHGLAYLHEDCEDCILHFDVKAGNILLDGDLEPKLCDFGVSELVERTGKTFISYGRRGTRGYMAPELQDSLEEGKKITDSADVYSFGMLLFEMVRGRPNVQNGCREQWTPSEARKMLEEGRVEQMMDPYLHQEVDHQQVKELLRIALQCTCEEHPDSRPSMCTVVHLLNSFTNPRVSQKDSTSAPPTFTVSHDRPAAR